MTSIPENKAKRRKLLIWINGGLAAIVLAAVVFFVWFVGRDAPDKVSIDNAASQVISQSTTSTEANTGSSSNNSNATSSAEGIDGTWSVDTSIGEFSYEDSTGTFVGFRIAENLANVGSTEAVGRTPSVSGSLTADGTTISEVTIEADMTALTTNERRRDDRAKSALGTRQYPMATFVLTEPIQLPEAALTGEAVTAEAKGELTIAGTTQDVTFLLDAQLVDNVIVVVGSLDVTFADYGISVPSSPMVLSVEDHGLVELQLFFTR